MKHSLDLFRYKKAKHYKDAARFLDRNWYLRGGQFGNSVGMLLWTTAFISELLTTFGVVPKYINVLIWTIGIGTVRVLFDLITWLMLASTSRRMRLINTGTTYSFTDKNAAGVIQEDIEWDLKEFSVVELIWTMLLW